jgi:parvulin-like peptidyl-prolyl isomerase
MKKLVLAALAVVIVALIVLPGCGGIPEGAIVKVGDGSVSKADFDKYMDQAKAQATQQPGAAAFPSPGTPAYNQYAAQLIDYLVQQELIRQEADKRDISVSDDEVEKALQDLYSAYGGKKKVDKLLEQQNMTEEQLRDLLRDQELGKKVYAAVTEDAKPSDEEIEKYYNENKAQFQQPEQRAMRHILVKDKATAEKIAGQLQADPSDANWKKLAKQYSIDDTNKDKGGDLGALVQGQMPPAFDKAAFGADKGDVVGPVKSPLGWHVLQVTDVTPAKEQGLDDVKDQISQMLSSQLVNEAWTDWLKKAKDEAEIEYAAGYDPAKLTAAPEAQQSQAPSSPQPSASNPK